MVFIWTIRGNLLNLGFLGGNVAFTQSLRSRSFTIYRSLYLDCRLLVHQLMHPLAPNTVKEFPRASFFLSGSGADSPR